MIQTAALPVTLPSGANLLQGMAQQSENGGDTGFALQFSALMATTAQAEPTDTAAETSQPAPPLQAATGKPGGKTDGKSLPDRLPFAATAIIRLKDSTDAVITNGKDTDGSPPPASDAASLSVPQLQSGLPLPVMVPVFSPAQLTTPSAGPLTANTEGHSNGPGLPLPSTARSVSASDMQSLGQAAVASSVQLPTILPQTTNTAVNSARLFVKTDGGEAVITGIEPTAATALESSPATRQTATLPALNLRQATDATVARPLIGRMDGKTSAPFSTSDSLPMEPAPLLPGTQPGPMVSDAGSQLTSAPTTSPAPQEPPRDFAALIDRLVEARESARTTLERGTIHAAIAHAEFGHISMQFQQDDGGLTVVLANSDPDFARAIQASTPAGQASTGGETGSPGTRPDAASQQSSQMQSQQQRSQSSTGRGDGPKPDRNPSPHQPDIDEPPQHSGIFA